MCPSIPKSVVRGLVAFATLLLPLPVVAQDYPPFGDPEDWAMYDRYLSEKSELLAQGRLGPNWLDGGGRFWYASRMDDVITLVEPATGAAEPLIDLERLKAALALIDVDVSPDSRLPFQSLSLLQEDQVARIRVAGSSFDVDLISYELTAVPEEEGTASTSEGLPGPLAPDGSKVAFLRDGNVWIHFLGEGREVQLTSDAEEFLRYTISGGWARIGAPWSPDSRYLVLERSDRRDMGRTPVVDWLSPDEEVTYSTRYSELQDSLPQEILYWDSETGEVTQVDLPRTQNGQAQLTVLGWRPDSSRLFMGRSTPAARSIEVFDVHIPDGAPRLILSETGPILPQAGGFKVLEDGFLWASDRDGHRHLYRYDTDGRLLAKLTDGEIWVEDDVEAVDEDTGWVYFRAYADPDRPYDMQFCRVRLDGTGYAVLTTGRGRHDVTLSPDRTYFLDEHSTRQRPPRTDLRRTDGTFVRILAEADIDLLRQRLGWVDAEEFVVKAADGETELWGALFKPYDFDPSKKYPVVINVYTTFYTSYSSGFLGGNSRDYAQLGFITLRLAFRGEHGSRSRGFAASLYGRVGCCEHEDAAAALTQLAADRPWMDLDRVGVFGGSWGGYHAARFLLMKPELFKVGIAERAWMDPADLGSMEVWMGSREENPSGYAQLSSLPLASRLEGKLLFVVNLADASGAVSSTFRMIDALIREGKPYDLLVVPDVGHLHGESGTRGQVAADYVWERQMPAYLVEHLIGPDRSGSEERRGSGRR
jgi:dipeptidyl aminopeptidase/acylaminoacyl peptidase